MSNRLLSLVITGCLIVLSGCVHVISKDMREKADPALTFEQIVQNPNAYKGSTVVWGGEIVETLNQKNGTTEIEVFQKPLDSIDAPKNSDPSVGRFIIVSGKFLDPYLYRKERRITVAGEILGEKIKPLGNTNYRYPVISSQELHLWEESYYYPYPYPYYYPWGFYDPWWGYPYWGGGLGFGYYNYPYYHGGYHGGHHGGHHGGGSHGGGGHGGGGSPGGGSGGGHGGGRGK